MCLVTILLSGVLPILFFALFSFSAEEFIFSRILTYFICIAICVFLEAGNELSVITYKLLMAVSLIQCAFLVKFVAGMFFVVVQRSFPWIDYAYMLAAEAFSLLAVWLAILVSKHSSISAYARIYGWICMIITNVVGLIVMLIPSMPPVM